MSAERRKIISDIRAMVFALTGSRDVDIDLDEEQFPGDGPNISRVQVGILDIASIVAAPRPPCPDDTNDFKLYWRAKCQWKRAIKPFDLRDLRRLRSILLRRCKRATLVLNRMA